MSLAWRVIHLVALRTVWLGPCKTEPETQSTILWSDFGNKQKKANIQGVRFPRIFLGFLVNSMSPRRTVHLFQGLSFYRTWHAADFTHRPKCRLDLYPVTARNSPSCYNLYMALRVFCISLLGGNGRNGVLRWGGGKTWEPPQISRNPIPTRDALS